MRWLILILSLLALITSGILFLMTWNPLWLIGIGASIAGLTGVGVYCSYIYLNQTSTALAEGEKVVASSSHVDITKALAIREESDPEFTPIPPPLPPPLWQRLQEKLSEWARNLFTLEKDQGAAAILEELKKDYEALYKQKRPMTS